MSVSINKTIAFALVSSVLVMTGCASKKPQSQIVVAPISNTGYAPNTYTGGALVDNTPDVQSAAVAIQSVVHFDFDTDAIRPDVAAILDQHVIFLVANPNARILIAGHTDERGSREYNMSLGERRATAVANYLATRGVVATNIEVMSYGEEQPVAQGSNEEAWAQNRRAELTY